MDGVVHEHQTVNGVVEDIHQIIQNLKTLVLSLDAERDEATLERERRALEILREMGATRVNWHCFGGRVKLAREIADHGHWLSIPANARSTSSRVAAPGGRAADRRHRAGRIGGVREAAALHHLRRHAGRGVSRHRRHGAGRAPRT